MQWSVPATCDRESVSISSKIIGAAFGLTAYAVALIVGVLAGVSADVAMWRALVAMVVCAGIGQALGAAALHAVREHINNHIDRHPVPTEPDTAMEVGGPTDSDVPIGTEHHRAEAA